MKAGRVIFLLTALLLSLCAALSTSGRKKLNDFIVDYEHVDVDEVLVLQQHRKQRRSMQDEPISLKFRAYDRDFDLILFRSDEMFAHGFAVEFVTARGRERPPVDVFVHYRGHLADLGPEHSDVRARFINNRLQGSIYDRGKLFYFEPASVYMRSAPATHVVYPATAVRMTPDNSSAHFCGIDNPGLDGHGHGHAESGGDHNDHDGHGHGDARKRRTRVQGRFQDYFHLTTPAPTAGTTNNSGPFGRYRRTGGANGNPFKNTCEMALVADHRVFAEQGSSLVTTTNTMISFLEDVTQIYKFSLFQHGVGMGIMLNIKQIIVYQDAVSQSTPFGSATSDSNVFLNQLSSLVWNSVCLAHAFTHQTFDSNVLGLAFIGTICRAPTSGSNQNGIIVRSQNTGICTSKFGSSSVARTTQMLVMAHEIGHNFGMQHDTNCAVWCSSNPTRCSSSTVNYGGAGGNFIMWPSSVDGSLPNNFVLSECSLDSAGTVINSNSGSGGFCFTNSSRGQICGNGIVQGTEACDCGSTNDATCFQNDPCCLTNCTLRAPAQCSDKSGPCCANCTMIGDIPGDPVTGSSVQCGNADSSRCYLARYCLYPFQLFACVFSST